MVTIKEKKLNNLQTMKQETHLSRNFDGKTYEQLARVSERISCRITRTAAYTSYPRELYMIILTNRKRDTGIYSRSLRE